MGWHEVMRELEKKLEGTFKGTYRPLEGVPFFRVQYPPDQEREALRQFRQLADRLNQRGWKMELVRMSHLLNEALQDLLGCSPDALPERLKALEQEWDRDELRARLSEHLPDILAQLLRERLQGKSHLEGVILLRTGVLYPFVRPSSLLARLEGEVRCAVVFPYPGTTLGAFLDAPPADPHGGYYRGEVISWR